MRGRRAVVDLIRRLAHGLVQCIHRHLTRAWPLLAAALGAALLSAGPARAHLTPEPAFLAVGSTQGIMLTVHNDRDAEMTGFRLTVPAGVRILDAGGDASWNESIDGAAASWTGGGLAAFEPVTFGVDHEAAGAEPGPVVLRGDQLYADGDTVSWPVTMTVVPPGGSVSGDEGLGAAAIVILFVLAALVVASFGLVFWQRRREARLQER
jgi:hypothetical protein